MIRAKAVFIVAVVILILAVLSSCTQNQKARSWGGTATVELESGQQLINATWKSEDLWLLTTKRSDSVVPKTYYFSEDSSFGVMEGTIIIKEQ